MDHGAPPLARPEWVSADSRGRLVVADLSARDLKVYDAQGARVATVGRGGHGPGEFVALWAGQVYRDSIVAFDAAARRVSLFAPGGALARSFAIELGAGRPIRAVRVVDDSLLLVIATPHPLVPEPLVALMSLEGQVLSRFFTPTSYFEGLPALYEDAPVIADAAAGVVFTMLGGSDSLFAFDYTGRRVGAGVVRDQPALITGRSLLEANGGRWQRADGSYVNDGHRRVIRLAALDSGTAVVQVVAYSARSGIDLLEGGCFLALALSATGALTTIGRADIGAGLFGRSEDGVILLGYADTTTASPYVVRRARLVASRGSAP
jgi:hypothetical protein